MPEATDLHTALLALLAPITGVTVYDGEPNNPPMNADGTVKPYVCVYSGGGRAFAEDICLTHDGLDWPTQITCVARDTTQVLSTVSKVRALLIAPNTRILGAALKADPFVDPGPVRIDIGVTPHRSYLPLFFRTIVTR